MGKVHFAPIGIFAVALCLLAVASAGFDPANRMPSPLLLACLGNIICAGFLAGQDASERVILASVAAIWIVCAAAYGLLQTFFPAPRQWTGPLLPGQIQVALRDCGTGPAAAAGKPLRMIFGSDEVIGYGSGPFRPVTVGTCPLPSFVRRHGGLVVDGFGYDSDDNMIWRIRENRFEPLEPGFITADTKTVIGSFMIEDRTRPDTLRLGDAHLGQQLTIRYLNRDTVQVTGRFRCGDARPVVFNDRQVLVGGKSLAGRRCATITGQSPAGIIYGQR